MASNPASDPGAHLSALHDDIRPAELVLAADNCTIGRAPTCQIVVPRALVSRLHAQIEPVGPRYRLRDLGSANGTFVNGHRLHEPHLLTNRDLIGLGAATALLGFVDSDATVAPLGRLRYDERTMRFHLGQQPVDLTPTQFRLLLHLYQHLGEVCTRESCAEATWGADHAPGMEVTTLDRLLSTIRVVFRQLDPAAQLIQTRPGLGFALADE